MIRRKTVLTSLKLDRMDLTSQTVRETPTQPATEPKRVTIESMPSTLKSQILQSRQVLDNSRQRQTLADKNRAIAQLQEEIMQKKMHNDAIKSALEHRESEEKKPTMSLQAVIQRLFGLLLQTMVPSSQLRKSVLKMMVSVCRQSGANRKQALKLLLIWLISWMNRFWNILLQVLR